MECDPAVYVFCVYSIDEKWLEGWKMIKGQWMLETYYKWRKKVIDNEKIMNDSYDNEFAW